MTPLTEGITASITAEDMDISNVFCAWAMVICSWRFSAHGACYAKGAFTGLAGSVMTNLKDMKARVNSTLHTFELVTAALNATSVRLREEQQRLV